MTPEALVAFDELVSKARKELFSITLDAKAGRPEAILEVSIVQAIAVLEMAKAQLATDK